jgi:hypothetical protein
MAGTDLPALVTAGEEFNRRAQPLAEAVMNDVVRGALTGLKEDELDPDQLGAGGKKK